ncbi:uncharacterized protein LOC128866880 [Anastrepha ludens]|uniref:uncharacterized protein LOC128866880 n=1 Tax=Anastrepha ludens TaxID=28586 RepID=UPI0023AFBC15|nr:uncharacterized protein LOC128866880 [Anastrepha ludens]
MKNFANIVSFVVLLAGCTYASSCQLKIMEPSPLFTKKFGSKTIIFKAQEVELFFEDGETIQAYCNDGIMIQTEEYNSYKNIYNSENDNMAAFSCDGTSILAHDNYYDNLQVSCYPSFLSFFESKKKLPKCGTFISYAIGVKFPTVGDVIKAGVCYDLDKLTLKFATYIAGHQKVSILNESNSGSKLSIDLNQKVNGFNNYFNFVNQHLLDDLQKRGELNFNSHEFQFVSLLQDEPLNTELYGYAYIFNTMWWRQLREENWRYFLNALHERTRYSKFLVYVGTYGNITIPAPQGSCSSVKSEVVSVRTEDVVVQAPAYIWAYLKSLIPGETENFVVIGHNSPYAKNPGHSEFCKIDMCDDIVWLKGSKFGNLRRLPTLGYTFCCRPEEVAKIIDNFPFEDGQMEATTKSTIQETMNYPDEW